MSRLRLLPCFFFAALYFAKPSAGDVTPVDCVDGGPGWGAWGVCTGSCRQGSQLRFRDGATPAQNGGKPCTAPFIQHQPCNVSSTQPIVPCSVTLVGRVGLRNATVDLFRTDTEDGTGRRLAFRMAAASALQDGVSPHDVQIVSVMPGLVPFTSDSSATAVTEPSSNPATTAQATSAPTTATAATTTAAPVTSQPTSAPTAAAVATTTAARAQTTSAPAAAATTTAAQATSAPTAAATTTAAPASAQPSTTAASSAEGGEGNSTAVRRRRLLGDGSSDAAAGITVEYTVAVTPAREDAMRKEIVDSITAGGARDIVQAFRRSALQLGSSVPASTDTVFTALAEPTATKDATPATTTAAAAAAPRPTTTTALPETAAPTKKPTAAAATTTTVAPAPPTTTALPETATPTEEPTTAPSAAMLPTTTAAATAAPTPEPTVPATTAVMNATLEPTSMPTLQPTSRPVITDGATLSVMAKEVRTYEFEFVTVDQEALRLARKMSGRDENTPRPPTVEFIVNVMSGEADLSVISNNGVQGSELPPGAEAQFTPGLDRLDRPVHANNPQSFVVRVHVKQPNTMFMLSVKWDILPVDYVPPALPTTTAAPVPAVPLTDAMAACSAAATCVSGSMGIAGISPDVAASPVFRDSLKVALCDGMNLPEGVDCVIDRLEVTLLDETQRRRRRRRLQRRLLAAAQAAPVPGSAGQETYVVSFVADIQATTELAAIDAAAMAAVALEEETPAAFETALKAAYSTAGGTGVNFSTVRSIVYAVDGQVEPMPTAAPTYEAVDRTAAPPRRSGAPPASGMPLAFKLVILVIVLAFLGMGLLAALRAIQHDDGYDRHDRGQPGGMSAAHAAYLGKRNQPWRDGGGGGGGGSSSSGGGRVRRHSHGGSGMNPRPTVQRPLSRPHHDDAEEDERLTQRTRAIMDRHNLLATESSGLLQNPDLVQGAGGHEHDDFLGNLDDTFQHISPKEDLFGDQVYNTDWMKGGDDGREPLLSTTSSSAQGGLGSIGGIGGAERGHI